MPSYNPGRPPNINDLTQNLNGSPQFLGVIASVSAAVTNNGTTATKFNYIPADAGDAASGRLPGLGGTLAGRVLLVQPTAAGVMLGGTAVGDLTMTQQSGAKPGVLLASGEKAIITMLPTEGWLQWATVSGNGNLIVWELR